MLTDEEKRFLIEQYSFGRDINAFALVGEVERAVLAKAMPIPKQEPFMWILAFNDGTYGTTLYDTKFIAETYPLFDESLAASPVAVYLDPQPAQAAAIPEGWQLVPIKPTESQRQAMYMAAHFDMAIEKPDEWRAVDQSYAAMLSASPKPDSI